MQTYTDPCTVAMQEIVDRRKEEIASDLANYMLEMMPDLNDCVDSVSYTHLTLPTNREV